MKKKFDPENNKLVINTFGEVNNHRISTFTKILDYGVKFKIIKKNSEKNKLIKNYIFRDFDRENISSQLGLIIPKSDLNPFLSTGAIIRHLNNSSVPVFFNFKNSREFYLNPDNCLIIQMKKLFQMLFNLKEIVEETKKKYSQLKLEAKNQNQILYSKFRKFKFKIQIMSIENISKMTLGTFQFTKAWKSKLTKIYSILDYSLLKGINSIETADEYDNGQIEKLIGDFKKKNSFFVLTKFGQLNNFSEKEFELNA